MDVKAVERLISGAFEGGARRARELRLSDDEAGYIAAHMDAVLEPVAPSGDKTWYKITFGQGE